MRRLLLLVLAFCMVCAAAVAASRKHGITPTAPKKGAEVAVGSRPTFTGKVDGPGTVFVYVSKSRKTNAKGVIKPTAKTMSRQASRSKGTFKVKAKFYDFPQFWLNSPGTYYWQAHRINCDEDGDDCLQEGPIAKLKVG